MSRFDIHVIYDLARALHLEGKERASEQVLGAIEEIKALKGKLDLATKALGFYANGEHLYAIPCDAEYGSTAKAVLERFAALERVTPPAPNARSPST